MPLVILKLLDLLALLDQLLLELILCIQQILDPLLPLLQFNQFFVDLELQMWDFFLVFLKLSFDFADVL